ncbi:hypothetical protein [Bradyrhizobium sp. dw_78]|uniref:hypothetical protein n=1 Tax=Bradyrhizobium sp. dw_78 TaxID=2719793 RepID=UPI001BD313C0|nr:hypothetical protein [Bradyrhizobium sp. dw_78]
MAKKSGQTAVKLERQSTGGAPSGFLAEEEYLDRRALWRLGTWGVVAVGAVIAAVLANQSSMKLRRDEVAAVDLVRQSQQVQSFAKESQNETRRLAAAIDTLNRDRDRLFARITVLEQGLDSVTGSIARQTTAGPPQWASPIAAPPPSQPVAQSPAPAPSPVPVTAPVATTAPAAPPPEKPLAEKPPAEKPMTEKPAAEKQLVETKPAEPKPAEPKSTESKSAEPKPTESMAKTVAAETPKPANTPPPQPAASTAPAPPPAPAPRMASKPSMDRPAPPARKPFEPQPIAKRAASTPAPELAMVAPAPPDQKKAAEAEAVPAAPLLAVGRTEFGVDVGGANSVAGLRALWRGLIKTRSNTALTGLQPIIVIREGSNGLGMQLRLVAGPFNDAAAAARICADMAERERPCETTVYDGQHLAMKPEDMSALANVGPVKFNSAKTDTIKADTTKADMATDAAKTDIVKTDIAKIDAAKIDTIKADTAASDADKPASAKPARPYYTRRRIYQRKLPPPPQPSPPVAAQEPPKPEPATLSSFFKRSP